MSVNLELHKFSMNLLFPDTHTLISIPTNDQKKDWFLKLNPNGLKHLSWCSDYDTNPISGRIPVLVDNTKTPPFTVMETSAELLYLLKEFDTKDKFGFQDELERSQCLQWLFFWHGSVRIETIPCGYWLSDVRKGAPIEGQLNWFSKLDSNKEKDQRKWAFFAIQRDKSL